MPIDPLTQIAVSASTSPRLLNAIDAGNFLAKLDVAVGEPTQKHFWALSGAITLTTDKTIPTNVVLTPTGGKFIKGTGGKLTVEGPIIAPRAKIFEGFDKYTLAVVGESDFAYPEWFGAARNNVTDDSDAIQLMYDVCHINRNIGGIIGKLGIKYIFGVGTYYCSKNIHLRYASKTEGAGSLGYFGTSRIRFGPNTKGFILEGNATEHWSLNCSITQGSNVVTSPDINFTSDLIGKSMTLRKGGGPLLGGYPTDLTGNILSVSTDGTQATLDVTAATNADRVIGFAYQGYHVSDHSISNLRITASASANAHTISVNGNRIIRNLGEWINRNGKYTEGVVVSMDGNQWNTGFDTVNFSGTVTGANLDTITVTGTTDPSFLDAHVTIINSVGAADADYYVIAVGSNTYTLNRRVSLPSISGTLNMVAYPHTIHSRFSARVLGNEVFGDFNINTKYIGATVRFYGHDYKIVSANNGKFQITEMDNSAVNITRFYTPQNGHAIITAVISNLPAANFQNQSVLFNIFHGVRSL